MSARCCRFERRFGISILMHKLRPTSTKAVATDHGGRCIPLDQITWATKRIRRPKAHIGNAVLVTDVHRCAGHVPFQDETKVAY